MDDEKPATGFPEPPGKDPGDRSTDAEPHHALSRPAGGDAEPFEDDPAPTPEEQPRRDRKGG